MNLIANIFVFLVIALTTGLSTAWYFVEASSGFSPDRTGAWYSWSRDGRASANPYTRANIARSGRLPVMAKSMLYYTTSHDSDGRVIDAECDYMIIGKDPHAIWWSISAYDGSGRLMDNPAIRHTYNASNVMRAPDGQFQISLSTNPAPGNWLPVDSDYKVRLILRMHRRVADTNSSGALTLPEIRRTACR